MNTDFQYFQSFLFTNRRCLEYVTDKSKSAESIICYMLSRLQKMFKYEGLPNSIPRQDLENYLLVNGNCVIGKDLQHPSNDKLYAFIGAAGGPPDIYYKPTYYMVANPALRTSCQYFISENDPDHEPNAVLVRNDTMWQGLYPMMARYASLIAENLLTIRVADVMLRILALITAPDDTSRLAADQFLKDITEGHLASVAENRFLEGIRMQNPPSNNGSYLTQFIELHQYFLGSFYNEIGLNANYNMKREALSESETGLNDDSLLPLADDMLRCRQEDMARVNAMFGTSIQVSFDSSWLENEIERLLSLRQKASEASSQLVNTAPMEDGLGEVSIEGASQLGASMEDASGKDDDENGEGNDSGTVDNGSLDTGSLDTGSEENKDDRGMDDNESGTDGKDGIGEDDGEEEDGEKDEDDDGKMSESSENGEEDEKIIDESGTSDSGIDVRVEVEIETPSDGKDEKDSDEGEENGEEVDDNGNED